MEQYDECWCFHAESEQFSGEHEHEHWVPLRPVIFVNHGPSEAFQSKPVPYYYCHSLPQHFFDKKKEEIRAFTPIQLQSFFFIGLDGASGPFKIMENKVTLENIASWDNLHRAFKQARRGKRYRREVLRFSGRLENNLSDLREEILQSKYRHGRYRTFIISDAKKRTINAAPFRDRVLHHAVCNIINPIFDAGFISDTYACRLGKGNRRAVLKLVDFLKQPQAIYCLKCDISSYFHSINHNILIDKLKQKIKNKKVIDLLKEIVGSYSSGERERGIPIGNLTSQVMANLYLNSLDQKIKRGRGHNFYLRYMDDFLIIDSDKKRLWSSLGFIYQIASQLRLTIHPHKVSLSSVKKGVDWLGYVVFSQYLVLRKSTVRRMVKRVRKKCQPLDRNSWINYASLACSYRVISFLTGPTLQPDSSLERAATTETPATNLSAGLVTAANGLSR